VISFNAKASADEAKKHENFVNRMVTRVTPPSRFACCASGICGFARAADTRQATNGRLMLQQIIDRRLAGKNKSIGNRERFLRRHQAQVRDAVRRAVDGRGIRDMERGEDIRSRSANQRAGLRPRPRWHARDGAPGQPGVCDRRPDRAAQGRGGKGGAARARPATPARAKTTSSSTSAKKSSCRSFSTTLRCRA